PPSPQPGAPSLPPPPLDPPSPQPPSPQPGAPSLPPPPLDSPSPKPPSRQPGAPSKSPLFPNPPSPQPPLPQPDSPSKSPPLINPPSPQPPSPQPGAPSMSPPFPYPPSPQPPSPQPGAPIMSPPLPNPPSPQPPSPQPGAPSKSPPPPNPPSPQPPLPQPESPSMSPPLPNPPSPHPPSPQPESPSMSPPPPNPPSPQPPSPQPESPSMSPPLPNPPSAQPPSPQPGAPSKSPPFPNPPSPQPPSPQPESPSKSPPPPNPPSPQPPSPQPGAPIMSPPLPYPPSPQPPSPQPESPSVSPSLPYPPSPQAPSLPPLTPSSSSPVVASPIPSPVWRPPSPKKTLPPSPEPLPPSSPAPPPLQVLPVGFQSMLNAWVPGLPSSARLLAISNNVGKSLAASSASITTTVGTTFVGTIYRLDSLAGNGGGTASRRLSQGPTTISPPAPLAQCTPCTPAITSAMATSLCALIPLQNCSLLNAACINASSAVGASSSYPALPSRALLAIVLDKNCSGYVAATIGYKDATQQDVVTRTILNSTVNVAGLGSISPPSSSDITTSTQLHIVVANGPSTSSSTAPSNPLLVDSGRVAQGVAAAMGLPSDKVSVSLTSSDSVTGSPAPGSTSSSSAKQANCSGKFRFGSLCGSAAAGAAVGAALGGLLILGAIALLGVALIPRGDGRVQPVLADAAAANVNVPTVAFVTTPSPPYAPHGGSDRVTQQSGVPWTMSPVRGEPVIWEPTPWHTNYVQPPQQPSSPSPGALSSGRWSASMMRLPATMRALDRSSAVAAQRRVAAYQAGLPTSVPSAAPASAAAAINAYSFRHGPDVPVSRPQEFYPLNIPGEGPAAGHLGRIGLDARVDPGGATTFDDAAQMQRGNIGAHPGAFGLVLSADHASPTPGVGRGRPYNGLQAGSPANGARGSGIYRGW
ncbi:hypothetical protein Vretifemale_18747, partial [Volvox reticuliferus]